jgi:hypothetical protein|nr:MAG TPA: hypothetical protein [Caudoviricetes sp.]
MGYVIKKTMVIDVHDTDFTPNKVSFKECNLTSLGILSELTRCLFSKDAGFKIKASAEDCVVFNSIAPTVNETFIEFRPYSDSYRLADGSMLVMGTMKLTWLDVKRAVKHNEISILVPVGLEEKPEFFPSEIHYPKYSAEYLEKALGTLLDVYEKEKDK